MKIKREIAILIDYYSFKITSPSLSTAYTIVDPLPIPRRKLS